MNSWTWPLVGAWVLVLLYLIATLALASPTAEGQPREPCKSQVLYCCIVIDGPSLPICETEGEK